MPGIDWDHERRRWVSLVAIAMLAGTVAACGGGGGDAPAQTNTAITPPPPPGTGSATLGWQPPMFYSDNTTPLTIQGYRFYAGTSRDNLAFVADVPNGGIAAYVLTGLATGTTWYFAVTAYDPAGIESPFSNIASKSF